MIICNLCNLTESSKCRPRQPSVAEAVVGTKNCDAGEKTEAAVDVDLMPLIYTVYRYNRKISKAYDLSC